jgi:hypothetical protein
MTVQSSKSYALYHNFAYEGMLVDQQLSNVISRMNRTSTAIPFGRGVVTDTDGSAKLPASDSKVAQFIGISLRELSHAHKDGDTFGAVPNRSFAIVTQGVIYVKSAVTVKKDDPVYLLLSDGTFTNVETGAIAITNAKWVSATFANGLARLSLVGVGG